MNNETGVWARGVNDRQGWTTPFTAKQAKKQYGLYAIKELTLYKLVVVNPKKI